VQFTLFGFFEYPEFTGHERSCGSLLECSLTVMHQGLLRGEGAVTAELSYDYSNNNHHLQVGSFDMLFWIVVTIVLLNCVFGIMLDTFAALRKEQEIQTDTVHNYCFICCAHRSAFASPREFADHREQEHSLKDYVYLMQRVSTLPKMERSGFESFVAQCVATHETRWMPIGESIRLSSAADKGEEGGAGGSDDDEDDDDDAPGAGAGGVSLSEEAMKKMLLDMEAKIMAEITALKEAHQKGGAGSGGKLPSKRQPAPPSVPSLNMRSIKLAHGAGDDQPTEL
jgi:hypothetical protein